MCRILLIHGIGGLERSDNFWEEEEAIITQALWKLNPKFGSKSTSDAIVDFVYSKPQFFRVNYDYIFKDVKLDTKTALRAISKLGMNGFYSFFDKLVGSRDQKAAISTVQEEIRWTAGMIVAWAESASIQHQCFEVVKKSIEDAMPDVIIAHSMGTLLAFDVIPAISLQYSKNLTFVTLGSQITNPFVLPQFEYKPPVCKYWFNLHNKHDKVFTNGMANIFKERNTFKEIDTNFDGLGINTHEATKYLSNKNVREVWEYVFDTHIKGK